MKHYCLHAILLASLALVACKKDNPATPPTIPIPEADLQLDMDRTTKVLYYGDRKTEGVYNYFLGLGDMEFIKDNEGDDAAPTGGHIIFFDIYASEGTDSYEDEVLPDGKYTIAADNAVGTLNDYYTRMQINVDGKQTSVDFTEGYLQVETSAKGKLLTALFTLKDGSTVSCRYEGPLVFGDPNAGSEPIEQIPELSDNIDATLRKRFDLLNKSIGVIKANTPVKGDVLELIVKLRSRKLTNFELDRQLYDAINEFHSYKEKYEKLKESEAFVKIEIGLNESEAEITAARDYYNDTITEYNKLVKNIPSNLVALVHKYTSKPYYDGKKEVAEPLKI